MFQKRLAIAAAAIGILAAIPTTAIVLKFDLAPNRTLVSIALTLAATSAVMAYGYLLGEKWMQRLLGTLLALAIVISITFVDDVFGGTAVIAVSVVLLILILGVTLLWINHLQTQMRRVSSP